MRGIQYAAAYRFNHQRLWILDRPPAAFAKASAAEYRNPGEALA
jgi:hypothetical protein